MRSKPTIRRPPTRRGFSLVELLAVAGIIAVLAGLFMPALAAVRARAHSVQCQSNLRQVGTAAVLHQSEHGYFPLAGWHWDPVGGVVNPRGLNDAAATRYTYYQDGAERRPAPVTAALAVSLGIPVNLGSRAALEADLGSERVVRLFSCPARRTPEPLRGGTQTSSEGWSAPKDWSDYVFNEAVLGRRGPGETPMGKTTRVASSSTVMLAMDGRPREQHVDNFLLIPDRGPRDTLLDFYRFTMSPANTIYGRQWPDFTRHRFRQNVLFLDGHVDSLPMTDDGMAEVGISKGIDR
jgi:prepilin-type N-terminal cleavage/methylation domain-containing protein/prepilin-type processing-associated H-X9-DG protein